MPSPTGRKKLADAAEESKCILTEAGMACRSLIAGVVAAAGQRACIWRRLGTAALAKFDQPFETLPIHKAARTDGEWQWPTEEGTQHMAEDFVETFSEARVQTRCGPCIGT